MYDLNVCRFWSTIFEKQVEHIIYIDIYRMTTNLKKIEVKVILIIDKTKQLMLKSYFAILIV